MKKLILIGLFLSNMGIAQTGGDFALEKATIAAGGGQSNGGDFIVTGSIGQHDANTASTGGDFALSGGFWVAKPLIIQPEIIFANGFEN
jgi:curli biogenesis system outer membrane secretion channel CsgG